MLESQLVSSSSRDITIRAVNDAPILRMGEIPLGGDGTDFLTVERNNPVSLNLNIIDIDARSSDGSESQMAFRLAITSASPNNEGDLTVFTVPPTQGTGLVNTVVVQPSSGDLGYIQFWASQTQANAFLQRISFVFPEGDYDLEFIAHDRGFIGFCPPNIAVDTTLYVAPDIRQRFGAEGTLFTDEDGVEHPSRCNRVSRVVISFNASAAGLVTATVPAAVGASVAALAAIGAVIYAKLRKPEDLDAWQALDGAMGANTMSSGIHVQAGSAGKSGIYQGS